MDGEEVVGEGGVATEAPDAGEIDYADDEKFQAMSVRRTRLARNSERNSARNSTRSSAQFGAARRNSAQFGTILTAQFSLLHRRTRSRCRTCSRT